LASVIARLHGCHIIHWVQDIYPEIAIAVTGQRWLAFTRPFRNATWRSANACVAISSDMVAVIGSSGLAPSNIVQISNWAPTGVQQVAAADAAVSALRREWNVEGKFVIAYSGNL